MPVKGRAAAAATKHVLEVLIDRQDARSRIQDRIQRGLALKETRAETHSAVDELANEFDKWNSYNRELLKRIFSTEEVEKEYSFWGAMAVSMREPSLAEKTRDVSNEIDKKVHRLDSIVNRLELIPVHGEVEGTAKSNSLGNIQNTKVFVVHGHDEIAKANLEVFLHENGLEPVVLHRQADEGLTIIEKFEKHSEVGYAFILLTPDEIAYLSADERTSDAERRKEFRARPNVIFEFGYFVGKLGRSRVCCLYTGNVALPSDVSGLIYKRYEKSIEELGYGILKDLRAAGYTV